MKVIYTVTLIFLFFVGACQQNKTEEPLSEKSFVISDTWIRPGITNRNTAAFMKITNNTNIDDTLFAVSSDLAKVVELHETYAAENDMIGMRHVANILIPSKSTIELKPGSFHIMLIGLNGDLPMGEGGIINLSFKNSGNIELPVEVK
jgi:periplasmic copper chaperone A